MRAAVMLLALVLAACVTTVDLPTHPSAVMIEVGRVHGSGVVISDDRVLTAAHVADAGDQIVVVAPEKRYPVDAVLSHGEPLTATDYAVLAVETDIYPADPYCGPLHVGQIAIHVGYPAFGRRPVRVTHYGRIDTLDIGEHMAFSHVVGLDLTAGPGSSGGPVYSADGRLIGLLVGGAVYGTGGTSFMVRIPDEICEAGA